MPIPFDPKAVAARLSRGQRSTITHMEERFCILGCSEATARRLTVGNSSRPALTQMRKGEQYDEFALTAEGLAVQAELNAARAQSAQQ